jgi:glycosyltransferase involved in cell wall biosynthesis
MSAEISVVIPTYNRAELIRDTINAVLAQSCPPSEIIVIDDGSTDDTARRLEPYGSRIRYHRTANSGVCRARNFGVRLARAPLIAFCDSDDIWRSEYLAHQARLFAVAGDVEYSFANFSLITDDGWSEGSKFTDAPAGFWDVRERQIAAGMSAIEESLYDRILQFQPIFLSAVMMTRRFFEKIGGFDERFSRNSVEDFEFTLRCVRHHPIGLIKEPLVGVRKHGGNLSRGALPALLGELAILRHAAECHGLAEISRQLVQAQIVRRSAAAAEQAFAARDLPLVRELCHAVPPRERSNRLTVKLMIAQMPEPLATWIYTAVVGARAATMRRGS